MAWQDHAACRGKPTELFFPERGQTVKEAKRICSECPVASACEEYVESFPAYMSEHGVWNGKSARQRRREHSAALEVRQMHSTVCTCGKPVPKRRRRYCSEACLTLAQIEQNRERRRIKRATGQTFSVSRLVDRAHGELRTYKAGCRCEDCTTANTVYVRKSRGVYGKRAG